MTPQCHVTQTLRFTIHVQARELLYSYIHAIGIHTVLSRTHVPRYIFTGWGGAHTMTGTVSQRPTVHIPPPDTQEIRRYIFYGAPNTYDTHILQL